MQGSTPWLPRDDSAERKHAPATLRNREPIAKVLQEELPVTGKVLEVASGSGEHCALCLRSFSPAISGSRPIGTRVRSARS